MKKITTSFAIIFSFFTLLYGEDVSIEEGFGPTPRKNLGKKIEDTKENKDTPKIDATNLTADIKAMIRAVEVIENTSQKNSTDGLSVDDIQDELDNQAEFTKRYNNNNNKNKEKTIKSERLNLSLDQYKTMQKNDIGQNYTYDVTLEVRNERLQFIYRELLYQMGMPFDEVNVITGSQRVDVSLKSVRWDNALSRILGQAGLKWKIEDKGDEKDKKQTIIIYENRAKTIKTKERKEFAKNQLIQATIGKKNAIAAKALFLQAEYDREITENETDRLKRMAKGNVAKARYLHVIEDFAQHAENDKNIHKWMMRSFLGMARLFKTLEEYKLSRAQYVRYISLIDKNDKELPKIKLEAANVNTLLGKTKGEKGAFDKAMEILEELILIHNKDEWAENEVTQARFALGKLFFLRNKYRQAQEQLLRYKNIHNSVTDEIRFYLGECDYMLALEAKEKFKYDTAEVHINSAISYFMELTDVDKTGRKDKIIDEEVYRNAWYRLGSCYTSQKTPDFVRALYTFIEARKRYPDSRIDGRILVDIAHCYSEMESSEEQIEALSDLLTKIDRQKGLSGGEDGKEDVGIQVENLIAKIKNLLGDKGYDTSEKAAILFYIAQANYNAAMRDEANFKRFDKAIRTYERVLMEKNAGSELRLAANIGIARAALRANDDQRAEQTLKELLRANIDGRNKAYVAQLLGDYYKQKGKLEKAIQAYSGAIAE